MHLKEIIVKHTDFDTCKNLLESLNSNSASYREYTNVFIYLMISIFSEVMVDENRSIDSIKKESLSILSEKL